MKTDYSTSHRPIVLLFILLLATLAASICFTATASPTEKTAIRNPQSAMSDCPGTFSDVCSGDWYSTYVMHLYNMGAIGGYADHTFRPNNNITRAQAMKVIVLAYDLTTGSIGNATFADVPEGSTFFDYVEVGAANGLTSGYPCGGPGEPC